MPKPIDPKELEKLMKISKDSYYKLLGLNKKATEGEIKNRYKELAHLVTTVLSNLQKFAETKSPDKRDEITQKITNLTAFQERITVAHNVLSDLDERKKYDDELERQPVIIETSEGKRQLLMANVPLEDVKTEFDTWLQEKEFTPKQVAEKGYSCELKTIGGQQSLKITIPDEQEAKEFNDRLFDNKMVSKPTEAQAKQFEEALKQESTPKPQPKPEGFSEEDVELQERRTPTLTPGHQGS